MAAEEAVALVPSLEDPERFPSSDDLQIALDEVLRFRDFQ